MPELRNCKRCNKVFSYVAGLLICPACTKEDEKLFERVNMYIRDNPGAHLNVVAEELDIPYETLLKYVKEGRLQVRSADGSYVMFCEKCGTMIKQGRFCRECENRINNVLEVSQRSLQGKVHEIEERQSLYRYHAHEKK